MENWQTERAQRILAGLKDAAKAAGWFHHHQTFPLFQSAPWHRPPGQLVGPPEQDIAACAAKQKSVFQKSSSPVDKITHNTDSKMESKGQEAWNEVQIEMS